MDLKLEKNHYQNDFHIVTPLVESEALSDLLSNNQSKTKVFLKLDNLQPSGSFKIRGINNLINEV